jgi:hypothetical protein
MSWNPPDLVPDGIEPLVGYRTWFQSLGRRHASLHSMNCSEDEPCPWEGDPSNWVTASCALGENHRAPEEGCSCGIYALKNPTELKTFIGMLLAGTSPWGGTHVLGRVELAGKIIEHGDGYRAEKARIAELMPFDGQTREVMLVSNRLSIPMSPPLRPPPVCVEYEEPTPQVVAEVEVRGANWLLTRWWVWWGAFWLMRFY